VKIAIIGCGYVADHYMATLPLHSNLELVGVSDLKMSRAHAVADFYGTKAYASTEELINDPQVELVVNLTNPESHYAVIKASLLAGKHVYSEKPLTLDLETSRELIELAENQGLLLSCAPCNSLSDTVQTLWKAVRDGAVGRTQLVYAEFDDNPIYLMHPEQWASRTGAPWPYLNEYASGCTLEHAGYHLTWLAAIFGPAETVTAFSSCLVPDKTDVPYEPADTPDFSVACIVFRSGVVARLTCSIVAPLNHKMTIIGNEGVLTTDTYRHYRSPVYLEHFSQLSLNARKARSVRGSPALGYLFGVGGRKQVLVHKEKISLKQRLREILFSSPPIFGAAIKTFKKREVGYQDKFLGVAEMADAINENRDCLLPPDFVLHVTELTLAISNAGSSGKCYKLTTSFAPISPRQTTLESGRTYSSASSKGWLTKIVDKLMLRMHR
jgi:predicted dehydrogenase